MTRNVTKVPHRIMNRVPKFASTGLINHEIGHEDPSRGSVILTAGNPVYGDQKRVYD